MAAKREDYGTDVMYIPNEGMNAPQQDFTEGVFIDYRSLDNENITPVYEFGFGLSYTTFSYSNLQISKTSAGPYTPSSGMTQAAPNLGSVDNNTADYVFPANMTRLPLFIYPYINTTDLASSANGSDYGTSGSVPAGSQDGSPQPIPVAGGGPGGNAELYDVLYQVSATITNTGSITGEEVAQVVSIPHFKSVE